MKKDFLSDYIIDKVAPTPPAFPVVANFEWGFIAWELRIGKLKKDEKQNYEGDFECGLVIENNIPTILIRFKNGHNYVLMIEYSWWLDPDGFDKWVALKDNYTVIIFIEMPGNITRVIRSFEFDQKFVDEIKYCLVTNKAAGISEDEYNSRSEMILDNYTDEQLFEKAEFVEIKSEE
jgi:hypothetical protein